MPLQAFPQGAGRPRFRRAVAAEAAGRPATEPGDPATLALVQAQMQAWLDEAVIGLNLCPFAKAVQARGQIRWQICPATRPEALLETLAAALRGLAAADPQEVDTLLLVHPWALPDFAEFHAFQTPVAHLVSALGLRGVIQVAAFHPRWRFAEHPADDPAHASNRAPWPTLHLLREASVARAVAAVPEAASIFARNIATLRALGEAGWAERARRWQAPGPTASGAGEG